MTGLEKHLYEELRGILAYVTHWEDDRASNLPPTAQSLARAKAEIEAALRTADRLASIEPYSRAEKPWYPDNRAWIEWRGGECPIPPDQMCEALIRGEREDKDYSYERNMARVWAPWDHNGSETDIVAYLPLAEDAR